MSATAPVPQGPGGPTLIPPRTARSGLSRRTVLGGAASAAVGLTLVGGWVLSEPRGMPSFKGATTWVGSPPLTPAALDGHVVLVQFWTFTCINWIRTAPYVRAWWQAYRDDGLIVVGVHTPEFTFEHDLSRVRGGVRERGIDYPVVVDNDYKIWTAFANNYWPALYLLDRNGTETHHVFGEGSYADTERRLQRLLEVDRELVPGVGHGIEAEADWENLRSAETYLGYAAGFGPASADTTVSGESHAFELPAALPLNRWGLEGDWTIARENAVLDSEGGRIGLRFLSRDVHLVLRSPDDETVRFRVTLDGQAPGGSHGVDVDRSGDGVLREARLYQLVRIAGPVRERTLEIEFDRPGAEAYAFTFG